MDCVVRIEGLSSVDVHERRAFESEYPLDFASLYTASETDRLAAYLAISFDVIGPLLPTWKVTTDIVPEVGNATVLPFVVNDLSVIRCPSSPDSHPVAEAPDSLTTFYRYGEASCAEAESQDERVVHPDPVASMGHAWVGEGFPIGANKVTADSFRRRLENATGDTPYISVSIVCNDPEMSEEDIVQEYYGFRDFVQFDVDLAYDLYTAELAARFREGGDFLHYIGRVDEMGFRCRDGLLDARELDEVNVESFLLNACRSFKQGGALVERGSLGGIVTLANVLNGPAVHMGRVLARTLNSGFSLQSALDVARQSTAFGNHYSSIGDVNLQLVNSKTGTSFFGELTPLKDGRGWLALSTYPTALLGMGSLVTPHVTGNSTRYLNSGELGVFEVTAADL